MSSPVEINNNTGSGDLSDKIAAQGDLVRKLKGDKKPKEEITAAVGVLLALKVRIVKYFHQNLYSVYLMSNIADRVQDSDWQ